MKHIIAFFLSLSIFCFIAFGISVAVLGTEPVSGSVLMSEYAELEGSYSDIEITTSVANIAIYPTEGEVTKIFATERLAKSVSAEIKDDKLIVKLDHSQHIFTDFLGFLGSLFDGGNKDCVKVYVPDELYDNIVVKSNAGSTEMISVAAKEVNLDLSAGNLTYAQPEGFKSEQLNVHLSAGNCTVYNARADEFDIEMSAGNIDVYGLAGEGEIDISAGNGNINLSELNGDITVNASAGNLDLNLPEAVNATIGCDKSAGSVTVNYGNIKNDLNDNEEVIIGSGTYSIFADISAGGINITDKVKEKEAPAVPEMPAFDNVAAVDSSVATTAISSVSFIDEVEEVSPITGITSSTEAPTWDREPTSVTHNPENDRHAMDVREGSGLVEYSFESPSSCDINIVTNNIDIAVYPSDDNRIKIYTSKKLAEKIYIARQDGATLNIQLDQDEYNANSAESNRERIELYLPLPDDIRSMFEVYPTYDLNLTSNFGNVEVLDVNLDIVEINVANGDLNLSQPNDKWETGFREIDISVEEGDCNIFNARFDDRYEFDISVNSGKLNVYDLNVNGNFNLNNCQANINMIYIRQENSITSKQSDIQLNIVDRKHFYVECIKAAGNVEIDYDDVKANINNGEEIEINSGEMNARIYLDVSDGDVKITDDLIYKYAPTPPNPPILEAA